MADHSDSGWGELELGNLAVGITRYPMRKSVAVTVRRGTTVYATAYCRNEEEADRLWAALIELTGTADQGVTGTATQPRP